MIDIIWDWVTGIHPTIWGSLLTGLMTLAGVLVGQFVIRYREERKKEEEIEALRDSLVVELRSYDEWLEWLLYAAHDLEKIQKNKYGLSEQEFNEATKTFETKLAARISLLRYAADDIPLTRDVYEANTSRIGELGSQSAESVVRTYSLIERLNKHLTNLQNHTSHEELLNEDINWETGEGLPTDVLIEKVQIEEMVARVVIFQKFTLALLGETSSPSDRATFAFAYTVIETMSKGDAKMKQYLQEYMEKYDIDSVEELTNSNADHPIMKEEDAN